MKTGGSQECPNCGACKESVEHVLFERVSYDSQRQNFLDYLRQVLTPDALETFCLGRILDKAVFCLAQKQGTCMLVKNEYSSW